MPVPIFQVDAFTNHAFSGNPAAVCILDRNPDEVWMQAVAAEMNLSETAFLVPGEDVYSLRWFTPAAEVRLCGHATLASAHILWSETKTSDVLRFETKSGILTARRKGDLIELDFPALRAQSFELPEGIVDALGVEIEYCGRSRDDLILKVKDEAAVRSIRPDFAKLREVEARGIIVTAAADGDEYDFVSRFFAPRVGINEDPVTGSAHCCLTPFWTERLGQNVLRGFQASARGGLVEVEISADRVKLRGKAITIFRGELLV